MVSDDVKRQLRGHTIVLKCLFEVQLDDGDCTLTLDLADERTPGSSVVRVQFSSVSDLSIRNFGGGITQVTCLDIEDVREWQVPTVADLDGDGALEILISLKDGSAAGGSVLVLTVPGSAPRLSISPPSYPKLSASGAMPAGYIDDKSFVSRGLRHSSLTEIDGTQSRGLP